MSRQVDADVVLAALREIGAGLDQRSLHSAVRVSNARHRLAGLIDRVENQAVTRESRVTELDGAGEAPDEGALIASPSEFAAAWNTATEAQRADWFESWASAAQRAYQCVVQDHAGAVEMQRRAFVSSVDLEHWARRMREFADAWDARTDTDGQIMSYIVMRGEGAARHEHEHRLTTEDLRNAAAFAQHLAHERIDHAVIFGVHHWVNATADVDIVSIDGRVLIDYSAVEALMTETGWTER